MKLLKKILVGAVFMAAGFAFAQTSMMKRSTAGLFGTDVDDFMSVNDWSNVSRKICSATSDTDRREEAI